ncbi:MAG: methyltransferase domain-containing protein [Verrucomicrobia bacterium]|nr:methyltransferase domain-containing protein [Verrucomicrobiota bacterium]
MNPDWQKKFFNRSIVTDFWNKCTPPEHTRAEADFLEKMFGPRNRLLDVPCGGGRHALELVRRGRHVTGIDISTQFIRQANATAKKAKLPAKFLLGDMRKMKWKAEFDGAYCFGNAFGYFPHADMAAFVAAVARSLKPGGRFIVDAASSAESLLPKLPGREWFEIEDILFLEDHRYLVEESCLETEMRFIRGGVTERLTCWHWIYSVAEIRRMLENAGLRVVHLFGGLDEQPFAVGKQLLIVSEKRG